MFVPHVFGDPYTTRVVSNFVDTNSSRTHPTSHVLTTIYMHKRATAFGLINSYAQPVFKPMLFWRVYFKLGVRPNQPTEQDGKQEH